MTSTDERRSKSAALVPAPCTTALRTVATVAMEPFRSSRARRAVGWIATLD